MTTNRAGLRDIRERMQQLYVYDLYAFRPELKPLAAVLYPYEKINCFFVGIHKQKRKLVVVTHYRILIIQSTFSKPAQIVEIRREAVQNPSYKKRFFTSSIFFEAEEEEFNFALVSRRVLELFVWAVKQPLPVRQD